MKVVLYDIFIEVLKWEMVLSCDMSNFYENGMENCSMIYILMVYMLKLLRFEIEGVNDVIRYMRNVICFRYLLYTIISDLFFCGRIRRRDM